LRDFDFFPVVDNVWCLRRPSYLTCSYLVKREDGLVFVDAGMSESGDDVRAALSRVGASPSAVRATLLTHWHNDHSSGAAFLEPHAPVYCHAYEGAKLTAAPSRPLGARLSRLLPDHGPLVLFKGLLKDGPSVQLRAFSPARDGELLLGQFLVIETPGHTPGHLSFLDVRNKVLFAGDALAVVKGEVRRMARPVTEELAPALESMKRLVDLDFEVLCPGHRAPLKRARPAVEHFRASLTGPWPLLG
jgi:glyoxylase-like metal-dependent hydrolase (beta-lactamase superfamily II)